jgi:hypothetical protein
MRKHYYNARWAVNGHPSIANVSFYASHDANAIRRADKIARELGVTNTPRTITKDGVKVIVDKCK